MLSCGIEYSCGCNRSDRKNSAEFTVRINSCLNWPSSVLVSSISCSVAIDLTKSRTCTPRPHRCNTYKFSFCRLNGQIERAKGDLEERS